MKLEELIQTVNIERVFDDYKQAEPDRLRKEIEDLKMERYDLMKRYVEVLGPSYANIIERIKRLEEDNREIMEKQIGQKKRIGRIRNIIFCAGTAAFGTIKEFFAANHLQKINKPLEDIVKESPKDQKIAEEWLIAGNKYKNENISEKAIKAYKKALKIDPEYILAWNNLGATYNNKKEYDKAINALEKALKIDPEYVLAWNNLGFTYNDKKEYDKAINALEKAVEIGSGYYQTWDGLGVAYEALGRECRKKAEELIKQE